ncbi:hypothetical protein C8J57DRAFT_1238775 [Mycena rebaudengoi]|nr:hypothetical protein C8J57DRAFT_1238775 [Mycena rebaudengoi]
MNDTSVTSFPTWIQPCSPINEVLGLRFIEAKDISDGIAIPAPSSRSSHNTPKLTCLIIGLNTWIPTLPNGFTPRRWNLPWAQLTEFHAPNVWIPRILCITVLEEGINLEVCVFNSEDDGEPDVDGFITMPKLRELHMTMICVHSVFWEWLTLPKLVDLSITALEKGDESFEPKAYLDFAQRSEFALTILALRFDFTIHDPFIIDLLSRSPTLKELTSQGTRTRWTPNIMVARGWTRSGIITLRLRSYFRICALFALTRLWTCSGQSCRCIKSMLLRPGIFGNIVLHVLEPFNPDDIFREEVASMGKMVHVKAMDFYGGQNRRCKGND